jgi:hypothetical protein
VLEQLPEGRARLDQRRQAVANVSWGQHSVFSAKLPRAPAVVGDGDHCRNRVVRHGADWLDLATQPFQDGWKPRPAPERDDSRRCRALGSRRARNESRMRWRRVRGNKEGAAGVHVSIGRNPCATKLSGIPTTIDLSSRPGRRLSPQAVAKVCQDVHKVANLLERVDHF